MGEFQKKMQAHYSNTVFRGGGTRIIVSCTGQLTRPLGIKAVYVVRVSVANMLQHEQSLHQTVSVQATSDLRHTVYNMLKERDMTQKDPFRSVFANCTPPLSPLSFFNLVRGVHVEKQWISLTPPKKKPIFEEENWEKKKICKRRE